MCPLPYILQNPPLTLNNVVGTCPSICNLNWFGDLLLLILEEKLSEKLHKDDLGKKDSRDAFVCVAWKCANSAAAWAENDYTSGGTGSCMVGNVTLIYRINKHVRKYNLQVIKWFLLW